jgi:orotidine-5'-phosphate decarboxylase
MTFTHKLSQAWSTQGSLLMVGLDPDPARFPAELREHPEAIFEFCRAIVDATASCVCGFKPQIAYFAAQRAEAQLEALCAYIRRHYPNLPVVLDAKRGDIGSTAHQYAREAFERYQADAVTVNPYMGYDSVRPYLDYEDRGVIVLCRTSNPGGSDLQFMTLEGGMPLYLHVAEQVATRWNTNGQCALVVGATFPEEIAKVRQRVGDMPLLIPGIGAQGGDIAATVGAGADSTGAGMMINSSRAILYASGGEDWRDAAARAARGTRDAINQARARRPGA